MRLLLLSLTLLLAGFSFAAQAQPVTFEQPAVDTAPAATTPTLAAPAPATPAPAPVPAVSPAPTPAPVAAPATLPDLTPDAVKAPTYGYTPPASIEDGKSTIDPRLEPWEKERRPERAQEAEALFAKLPVNIQNQILDETHYVHRQCGIYQTYAQFHDCDCIGSIYFEERVLDPESSRDAIVGRISGYCVSLPGAAAFGYGQCASAMRYMLVPSRADEYCKCYAVQFGKNYQRNPSPDFDNIRALGKRTTSYCIQNVPHAFKNQVR